MSAGFLRRVSRQISDLTERNLLRTLDARRSRQGGRIELDGRELINFCSNDYLGMSSDEAVIQRVSEEVKKFGVGSGSASLLSGRSSLHAELEKELARFAGSESALIFSSGYLANTGAIPALTDRKDFIFHDKLNHASLIDGVLASKAAQKRYPHGKTPDFSGIQDVDVKMLVTESVFSMDGDLIDLSSLLGNVIQNESVLYVDDAHGFGIVGNGKGAAGILSCGSQLSSSVLVMITFGKALGSMGAAILGSNEVIDFLVQKARTYIYDTAIPPLCVAAALESLTLLEACPKRRQSLFENIRFFRRLAIDAGIQLQDSDSPIQPIIFGSEEKTIAIANYLMKRGFYVRPIRPPTVPPGTSRIRLTITSSHNHDDILSLIQAIKDALASRL
ncbi:MAG: aminotransferase class I/II-fold pyridoxal phosphate-dependent enzyme [Gammaproteobacteria bacterium]